MNLNRTTQQLLESMMRSGVTHIPRPLPVASPSRPASVLAPPSPAPVSPPVAETGATEIKPAPSASVPEVPPQPVSSIESSTSSQTQEEQVSPAKSKSSKPLSRKQRESTLTALAARVASCKKCKELAEARTQTVFGIGDPEARVLFVGEAPGADEDAQGEPFVGRAGKLLTKIIEACGWTREELYICNILRCRPPGNRNPSPIEADNCSEFLLSQIETVNPEYIVCWGTIAAQNLLKNNTPIGRLRGKFFEFGTAKVLCTYHPSYLLRNPSAKKHVWEDLKILLRDMGIDPDQLQKTE